MKSEQKSMFSALISSRENKIGDETPLFHFALLEVPCGIGISLQRRSWTGYFSFVSQLLQYSAPRSSRCAYLPATPKLHEEDCKVACQSAFSDQRYQFCLPSARAHDTKAIPSSIFFCAINVSPCRIEQNIRIEAIAHSGMLSLNFVDGLQAVLK